MGRARSSLGFALDGSAHYGEIGLPERRGRKGYAEGAKEDKKGEKRKEKIIKIKNNYF
jgi:hypothetical protein